MKQKIYRLQCKFFLNFQLRRFRNHDSSLFSRLFFFLKDDTEVVLLFPSSKDAIIHRARVCVLVQLHPFYDRLAQVHIFLFSCLLACKYRRSSN